MQIVHMSNKMIFMMLVCMFFFSLYIMIYYQGLVDSCVPVKSEKIDTDEWQLCTLAHTEQALAHPQIHVPAYLHSGTQSLSQIDSLSPPSLSQYLYLHLYFVISMYVHLLKKVSLLFLTWQYGLTMKMVWKNAGSSTWFWFPCSHNIMYDLTALNPKWNPW